MKPSIITIVATLLVLGAGCPASPTSAPPSQEPVAVTPETASERLDLSGRGLTALPAGVLDMTGLDELDISGNRIGGALPAEIRHLSGLRVLDASGNVMTGVPAEIGQLSELRTLDLSDNRLTGLPHELANLKRLETLDLRGNDVSQGDLEIIKAGLPQAKILTD